MVVCFAENCMSGENPVPEIWAQKDWKMWYVWWLISRVRKEISKIWIDFWNPLPFLYKNLQVRFSVSRPLHPQNWVWTSEPKKSQFCFFDFFEFGLNQIGDNWGLGPKSPILRWRTSWMATSLSFSCFFQMLPLYPIPVKLSTKGLISRC